MGRVISGMMIFSLCLLFGIKGMSYGESGKYKVSMQEHIEDVKQKHPEKYRTMVERAGENITDSSEASDYPEIAAAAIKSCVKKNLSNQGTSIKSPEPDHWQTVSHIISLPADSA